MRQSFKVSFYLRSNYENKEGKSPVMLRIFLGGAMRNLGFTKFFVDKLQWNNNTSRQKVLLQNILLSIPVLMPSPPISTTSIASTKMTIASRLTNFVLPTLGNPKSAQVFFLSLINS